MARAADTSTTYMPRFLVAAAIVLLVARAVVWFNTMHDGKQQISSVRWTPVEEFKRSASLANGKLVLYKFCANWSDPCQRLESEVFINHKISDLANADFLTVCVADRVREDGTNTPQIAELQKRYHVFAFPTLVIADANGDSKGVLVGCSSSLATYRFLARASQTESYVSAHK